MIYVSMVPGSNVFAAGFNGLRPNVGFTASSIVVPGAKLKGEHVFQCLTSVRGVPFLNSPVFICTHDFPRRCRIGYGPSNRGPNGVTFAFRVQTCVAVSHCGGMYTGTVLCRLVWAGGLSGNALTLVNNCSNVSPVPIGVAVSPGNLGLHPKTTSAGVAPKSSWNEVLLPKISHGSILIHLEWNWSFIASNMAFNPVFSGPCILSTEPKLCGLYTGVYEIMAPS